MNKEKQRKKTNYPQKNKKNTKKTDLVKIKKKNSHNLKKKMQKPTKQIHTKRVLSLKHASNYSAAKTNRAPLTSSELP
jgi:hypothetical protein